MRTASALLIAFTVLLAAPAALWAQAWPGSAETADLLKQADAEVASLELTGDPSIYTRANLRDLIGPAAEKIFAYQYQWTVSGRFRATNAGTDMTADLYRFATDLDAFGAFSMDRDPAIPGEVFSLDRPTAAISAYWKGNQAHLWRGPFYIRIVPANQNLAFKEPVLELARAIAGKLPPVKKLPAIFGIPPQHGVVVETIKYQHEKVLGQPALQDALTAVYGRRLPNKIDVEMELVLFEGSSPAQATSTFSALQAYMQQGGVARPVPTLGQGAFVMRHPTHGQVYAMLQGKYVAMLHQASKPQAAEGLLREIAKNIRLAE